jgi:hypothetical protein
MAIQISGTNVIDNDKNLVNAVNITASGTISGNIVATKAQAETGTDNTKLMTPLRVAEAITALGGQVINRIQRGSTSVDSSPNGAAGGEVNVPITSVNTAKSMISQGNRGNIRQNPASSFYVGSGSARLTSSTNVAVTTGDGGPPPSGPPANSTSVDWEVIEFK